MLEVELLGDELILLKKFNDPPLIIQIVNVYCRNFGKVRKTWKLENKNHL